MTTSMRWIAAGLVAVWTGAWTVVAGGDAAAAFTPQGWLRHVQVLADDGLGGRYPGTPGMTEAEAYIAGWFERCGLEPGGTDGSWFQEFTVERGKSQDPVAALLDVEGLTRIPEYGRDFVALPFGKPGRASGPLAFIGYGVQAEEYDYDDYGDFDVTGKVLLMVRHEPKGDDPEAEFGGTPPSANALFVRKARIAAEHGATAVLIVNSPSRDEGDELYEWSAREARNTYELPMVQVTQALADELLALGGQPPLAELVARLDRDRARLSSDLGTSVTVDPGVSFVQARNVIGRLTGSQRPDEYIVVGAHHDHVGLGRSWRRGGGSDEPVDRIHNGADDNASGTAGVLELARAFAQGPQPRRSILFMTFSAEEMGLLGSKHYCEEPTVPLESIRAMFNLDMIGRLNQDKFTIFGTSTAAEFEELVERANEPLGLRYDAPQATTGIFNQSDHASFYKKDIPVLFTFTGLHAEYHRPPDDWELTDPSGAAHVVELVYNVVSELANMAEGPTFTKWEPPEGAEGDSGGPGQSAAERMPRVRLGIMPSYDGGGDGLLIDAVVPTGAAAEGGMQSGDRIMKIAGRDIGGIRDYMGAVRRFEPGDEAVIVVRRAGQDVELTVRFAGTPEVDDSPDEAADEDPQPEPADEPEPIEMVPVP